MFRFLNLVTAFCLFFSPLLLAQEAPVFMTAEPAIGADEEAIQSDRLYLDFKGASLLNVLTILSELSGINFVAGKEVAAREVNMVLDDVTLEDALEAISRGSNITYDYIPNRNIYLFRAAADPETSPLLITRVFKLYYIRASQLREISGGAGTSNSSSGGGSSAGSLSEDSGETTSPILTIIENILSDRGKVNVDDRSNSLVVTDTEDRIRMIEEAIVQLDRPLQQVLIEVFLIETLDDFDKFLGIDWTSNAEGNIGVITGGSTSTRFPFNTNLPFFDKNPLKEIVDKSDLVAFPPAAGTTTLGTKNFSSLVVTFKALQTANKVKVLAKPRILVLDNSPAIIKITTNAAIGSNSVTTATGQLTSAQNTTTERAEVGTSLRLTPLINTDNRITLTLEPSFATLAAASFGPASTTGDVTTRTARTTLMLNDGQTVVLGGLLQSSQNRNKKKVPILGDVPFFGEAFTRRNQGMEDRELMLFISPHIVRDPSEVRAPAVPDERDRLDDEFAPFWRVKRKNWFKKIMVEPKPESSKIEGQLIAEREEAMADTLEIVASEIEEEPV